MAHGGEAVAVFPALLRKLLAEKEEVVGASQSPLSPLNDNPKHTQFLQHTTGGKKGGKKEKRRKEGGRQGKREGGRKERRKPTNLFRALISYPLLRDTLFLSQTCAMILDLGGNLLPPPLFQ